MSVSLIFIEYEVVSVYGPNMIAAEGPEWKRYRSVAKPAFNEVFDTILNVFVH